MRFQGIFKSEYLHGVVDIFEVDLNVFWVHFGGKI